MYVLMLRSEKTPGTPIATCEDLSTLIKHAEEVAQETHHGPWVGNTLHTYKDKGRTEAWGKLWIQEVPNV